MSEKRAVEETLQEYLDKVREELKNGEGKELYKLFTSSRYNDFYGYHACTPKNLSITGIEFILAKVEKEEDLIGIPQETDGEIKSQLVILYKGEIIPYKKTDLDYIKLKVMDRKEKARYLRVGEDDDMPEEKFGKLWREKDIEDLIKIVKAILTENIYEIYYSELYFDLIDNKEITYEYGNNIEEKIEYKFYGHKENDEILLIEIYYRRYRISGREEELEKEERIYSEIVGIVDFPEMIKELGKLKLMMEDDTLIVQECVRKQRLSFEEDSCTYKLEDLGNKIIYSVIAKDFVITQIEIPKYIRIDQIIDVLEMIMHNGFGPKGKTRNKFNKVGVVRIRDIMEERKLNDDDDGDIDVPF